MKRFLLIVAFVALGVGVLSAQRVSVGRYVMPTLDAVWLSDRPALNDGKALFLEFFHSTNTQCRARVDEVNELAYTYNNILNVVVVAREPAEQVASILLHDYQNAYVAIDEIARQVIRDIGYNSGEMCFDGNSCAVLTSVHAQSPDIAMGEVLWIGNPTRLTKATIEKLLQL